MDLFDQNLTKGTPLAERLRPQTLEDFFGQEEIIGQGKILRQAIEADNIPSMIFWGPPGCGKTTLARIIANLTKAFFIQFSAVGGSVKEVREVITKAVDRKKFNGQKTILFVDEIHRFSKSQQDAFLPPVENGTITLIGATTENPSFEVISALLSRTRVFVLKTLSADDLKRIINSALHSPIGFQNFTVNIDQETIDFLAQMSSGDARIALNALELAVNATTFKKNVIIGSEGEKSKSTYSFRPNEPIISSDIIKINHETIKQALQKTHLLYDKTGEEHYNIISALHKSLRGSDANAGLYWLGRMLESGEDPLYIARRLVRFASEDVGLADPKALVQAVAMYQAVHFIGMPECSVNLAQTVVYLAQAPKSNQLYSAYQAVQKDIKELPAYPVPLHLRNAPTKLMKELNYGANYKYNPDFKEAIKQDYFPPELKGKKYFE